MTNLMDVYSKKHSLFKWLFVASIFFTLAMFIGNFFSVYYESVTNWIHYRDERRMVLEFYTLKLFGVTSLLFIGLIIWSMRQNLPSYRPTKLMLFLCLYFVILMSTSLSEIRAMFFFGIILTVFVFDFFIQSIDASLVDSGSENILHHSTAGKLVIIVLCVYLILPTCIYLVNLYLNDSHYFKFDYAPQLYIYDSFRGISLDRIQYSFLAGLLILVILTSKRVVYYYAVPLLLLGLYLAQSRAVFAALIVSAIFLYAMQRRHLLVFIGSCFFLLLVMYLLGFRPDFFEDGGARINMLKSSVYQLFRYDISGLLLGNTGFYTLGVDGQQPHNSILQSLLNFGLITTLLWLAVLYQFYKRISKIGRVIFIYVMIFGLFHAGFSAFVFVPITLMSYMFILAASYPMTSTRNEK